MPGCVRWGRGRPRGRKATSSSSCHSGIAGSSGGSGSARSGSRARSILASFLYGGGLLAAGVARHWHNECFALPVVAAVPLVGRLARVERRGAVAPSEPEPFA